jgi:hypothetical protein
MTTAAQVQNWLKGRDEVETGTTQFRDPIRVVLVEVSPLGSATKYLSNRPYSSGTTQYEACISGGVTFTEAINLNGGLSIGYGDIEIANPVKSDLTGERDEWLTWIWANKAITVWIGDLRWPRVEFFQIFSGLVRDIDSKNRTSLNLLLVDNMQLVNSTIAETTIAATAGTSNSQQLVPLAFGECFNVTPVSLGVVGGKNTYQVHNGVVQPIDEIIEVRDNGAPIQVYGNTKTDLLSEGKFQLANAPYGAITCSVRGAKPSGTYQYRVGEVVQNILSNYGRGLSNGVASKINTTNFANFDSATPANVGVYINSRENVLDVCSRITSSIGAYLVLGLDGRFKLTQLLGNTSNPAPTHSVTQTDMEERSLAVRKKVDVEAAVKLGYCKNWTIQATGLAAGLPQANAYIFARDYYYIKKSDATLVGSAYYNQSTEPPARETLLTSTTQADAEASRILELYKAARYIYSANFYAHMLVAELGDTIKVTHPRFGLGGSGKTGTIVEINRDWLRGRVTLGIFI